MDGLNAEQQLIVSDRKGARCILAGPGTGKTATMVELFNSLRSEGVPASAIRCVTFSREAAETIEKRAGVKGVFSTLHGLGYEICSENGRKPVEPELRHRLMFKLVRKWGIEYKYLDAFIAKMRHQNISPADAAEKSNWDYKAASAFAEYERVRATEGWMDFDSMLCDAMPYLENSQNRARWQFEYLIVDEAQDTDDLQWRLMQLLSEKHGNITVVGDPNQAIYSWRGARPENITNFKRWFPNGRYFYLGRNYRSTQTIVNFVRENAPHGCPKELLDKMLPARNEVGAPIGLKMYWSETDEAESAIKLAAGDPAHSIILARTNRMLGALERICNRHSVRYHLLGRSGFWKQNEIRKAVEKLKDYPSLPLNTAMSLALPSVEAHYAVDDRTDRDNDALENLQVLRVIGKDFQSTQEFYTYANKMMHRRNDARGITISTVHQAKGGEWKNVYLIGCKNGMMPHKNGEPEEEERIYFVAISRAIDFLRISFAGTPSRYLSRYLTDEIRKKLEDTADEVEHLQSQQKLF